jgi:hypothetical protein
MEGEKIEAPYWIIIPIGLSKDEKIESDNSRPAPKSFR